MAVAIARQHPFYSVINRRRTNPGVPSNSSLSSGHCTGLLAWIRIFGSGCEEKRLKKKRSPSNQYPRARLSGMRSFSQIAKARSTSGRAPAK